MPDSIPCTRCSGTGQDIATHVRYADGSGAWNVHLRCSQCQGSGRIPPEMPAWIEEGRRLQKLRIKRGVTLRRLATDMGVAPSQVSAWEFGREDPAKLREWIEEPQ